MIKNFFNGSTENRVNRIFLPFLILTIFCLLCLKIPRVSSIQTDEDELFAITTFNTEYWHSSEAELLQAIEFEVHDFILLQEHLDLIGESYIFADRVAYLESLIPNRYIEVNGEVVSISKWPVTNRKEFGEGTGLRIDVVLPDETEISVYNIHLPVHLHISLLGQGLTDFLADMSLLATTRDAMIKDIVEDIERNENHIVIGGDFNTSLAMNSLRWVRKNMKDAFSAKHCHRSYGTWVLGPLLSWRIDYLYSSTGLQPISYCTKDISHISDHRAISVSYRRKS